MPSLTVYELDPTGTNPVNSVKGEVYNLPAAGFRVIAPRFGAFFADTLEVVNKATGKPLLKSQYYAAWRYKVPTSKYKRDICGLIVITDPAALVVQIDYQVLGNPYSIPETEVADMITRRMQTARPSEWDSVLPKPPALTSRDFTDDKYGFERLENALTMLAQGLARGADATNQKVLAYIEAKMRSYMLGEIPEMLAFITAHTVAVNDHQQYLLKTELDAQVSDVMSAVKKPKNVAPASGATGIARINPSFTLSAYFALYGIPQASKQLQVSLTPTFDVIVADAIQTTTGTDVKLTQTLVATTTYYWRSRYRNKDNQWSPWSASTSFTTA